jgi:hypothetical protein
VDPDRNPDSAFVITRTLLALDLDFRDPIPNSAGPDLGEPTIKQFD